ncbi:MAG: proline dehydrogenase family protein [Gemmatimonadetes bacterium]|nr:proline dehydrogenase family protein [Gemmatimonadota bacterium]MBT8478007.1 proline dehydrogenase family protein [Gemmatimonadota bacterium]NNK49064.1 proline dehydrogenase [Gemmatimonadota bacterium]
MGLARAMLLKGSESRWLADQLSRRRFVRRATSRFLPGESMDDALRAAASLAERGITAILTLLGENVDNPEAAATVADELTALLERAATTGLDLDISVKPTHLGLDLGFDIAAGNLQALASAAARRGQKVAVDMESTPYCDPTLDLYRVLRAEHDNVGICLQSYLFRADADLEALLPMTPMIRLVKGAYKEPASLAYPKKGDVDASYLRLSDILLEAARDGTAQASFGTHDAHMIAEINRRAADMKCPREAYEFQMLYGIERDLQTRLAATGYRMRVLISYGAHWFPWYMRRLAERPANVGFVLRSLLRG